MPRFFPTLSLLAAAYMIGAIPFGYLIGRYRGVDLFRAGSGNIGATNAGRVLGRGYGILVFLLDFLKGALPVASVGLVAAAIDIHGISGQTLAVAVAALAFLGHQFPIYLGFRGGKGIATGAGTIIVLAPAAAALSMLMWVVVLLVSRIVSLASLAAVTVLLLAWFATTPDPFGANQLSIAVYLVAGTGLVFVKHRMNVGRLIAGTENRIGDFPMRETWLRVLHIMALGIWFGGAGFFNFVTAPSIFASFQDVVAASPSDRTAGFNIAPPGTGDKQKDDKQKNDLANALAGSAVGPVFPRYFAMQAICGSIALLTALIWWGAEPAVRVHRCRVFLLAAGLLSLAIAWPLSAYVSELRLARFSPNPSLAAPAREQFGPWHLASLFLSFVTVSIAGIALALAAKLPVGSRQWNS